MDRYKPSGFVEELPFEFIDDKIIVTLRVNDNLRPLRFIFDTGAGFSLVCFENFVRKNRLLVSGFKYESVGTMAGIGHTTKVYHGKATSFSLGNDIIRKEQMPVTLQASNGKSNWNPVESGSLGIKFIQNYNLVINLVDKVIAFQ